MAPQIGWGLMSPFPSMLNPLILHHVPECSDPDSLEATVAQPSPVSGSRSLSAPTSTVVSESWEEGCYTDVPVVPERFTGSDHLYID